MTPDRQCQIEAHEIHRGKGLDVHLSLALASSTIHIATPPRSPSPPFRHGTGGEENILQPPALLISAATIHRTFEPTNLTSTYFLRARRVFGCIGYRTQSFRSGVRCSNH
ncbi:uncharacterized protein TNCV_2394341 [Trichonephila clavipes]|nr:uncharacterized protein TNCV_2394341 [Trichonephila clavipes]